MIIGITEEQKDKKHWETKFKMVDVTPTTSIITLYMKGLNNVIKR